MTMSIESKMPYYLAGEQIRLPELLQRASRHVEPSERNDYMSIHTSAHELALNERVMARGQNTANFGKVVDHKLGGYIVRWEEDGSETFVSFFDVKQKSIERVE